MIYLAQTDLTELSVLLGAVFGAFGAILIGFYKYANAREKDFYKSRENQVAAFDKTIEKLSKSLDANVSAHKDVARETKKAANEAAERNGHLAELIVESKEYTTKVLKDLKIQNVTEQTVEHQHIKEKE